MKGKAIKNIITTVGLPVLFGALIFTLWQTKVLHALFKTDEIILPLPTRIGSIIGDNFTNMLPQIASTLIVGSEDLYSARYSVTSSALPVRYSRSGAWAV